jgi:hypothetical protein
MRDLPRDFQLFPMKSITYFVRHTSQNHVTEERLQRKKETLVEPETVLRLHKTVCGVYRLHKRWQKVIAQ